MAGFWQAMRRASSSLSARAGFCRKAGGYHCLASLQDHQGGSARPADSSEADSKARCPSHEAAVASLSLEEQAQSCSETLLLLSLIEHGLPPCARPTQLLTEACVLAAGMDALAAC